MLWRLQLINQLNRFFALQALVERLGICIAIFGLKFPILLNWVRFRPGICDGGATSSTGRGAADNSPTLGCFGLAPSRLSKQWGMDILPIFLLRLGSSCLMWITSLASLVTWEGSLSIMLKSSMEGRGWWKSLQCFSIADVVDLECSLVVVVMEDFAGEHGEPKICRWCVQLEKICRWSSSQKETVTFCCNT